MRPCRLLLSHCKRMGMSQIHNFSFMGWRSHSPNIPCLTGVQPGASPSPDKVIKKLWKLPQDGLKHSHGQNVDFFFFFCFCRLVQEPESPEKGKKMPFFFPATGCKQHGQGQSKAKDTHSPQRTQLRAPRPAPLASTHILLFYFLLHLNYTIAEVSS